MEGHNWAWEVPQFLCVFEAKLSHKMMYVTKGQTQSVKFLEILNIHDGYDQQHGWPPLEKPILK